MYLSSLSDEELARLIEGHATSETLRHLHLDALDAVTIDEAIREQYGRRLRLLNDMDEPLLSELMALPFGASAREVIGEAAMHDQLPEHLLHNLSGADGLSEWTARQIEGRILVSRFAREPNERERREIVSRFFALKLEWAVSEVIEEMELCELGRLHADLTTGKMLSRGARHSLRGRVQETVWRKVNERM